MMNLREQHINKLENEDFDVLIIGAGINGAVCAAALSAKGVKTALIDKGDFAGQTSSNSSSLIWGGIKYLESHEYKLVHTLCQCRNQLMHAYPSVVKEIRFLTAIPKQFRWPKIVVYFGTLLYWIIGGLHTKAPKLFHKSSLKNNVPLMKADNIQGAVEYSDCFLSDADARFTFNFISSSIKKGCSVANYLQAEGQPLRPSDQAQASHKNVWIMPVIDAITKRQFQIKSKVIINACGPYSGTLNRQLKSRSQFCHSMSKGVHLIVKQLSEIEQVLAFFADDGRLFFAIPMGERTCIGTTDTLSDTPNVSVSDQDRQFILDNINARLNLSHPLNKEDIIAERCGVRPLARPKHQNKLSRKKTQLDNTTLPLSRKHIIEACTNSKQINIFGGKLTDSINIGEEVCALLPQMGVHPRKRDATWYGESSNTEKQHFLAQATTVNVMRKSAERLWRYYDSDAITIIQDIAEHPERGEAALEGTDISISEVYHQVKHEMVVKLDDYLRRRTLLAMSHTQQELTNMKTLKTLCLLLFGNTAQKKLDEYLTHHS